MASDGSPNGVFTRTSRVSRQTTHVIQTAAADNADLHRFLLLLFVFETFAPFAILNPPLPVQFPLTVALAKIAPPALADRAQKAPAIPRARSRESHFFLFSSVIMG